MQNAKPEKWLCPGTEQNNKNAECGSEGVQPLLCETMNPGKPGAEGPEAHDQLGKAEHSKNMPRPMGCLLPGE